MKTQGISPKAFAATVAPVLTGLIVSLINWLVTGVFDATSISAALAGLSGGLLSGGSAFVAAPGQVTGAAPAGPQPAPTDMPTAP